MDKTPNLNLPYLAAAQAQKHVTHNEALRALDISVQLSVIDRDLAAPPVSPADGDRYLVASGGTGDWAGHDLEVAAYQDNAWMFYPPRTGWVAWITDEAGLAVWNGTDWIAVSVSVNPVALLGVNATADATNKLSVSSPAALFNHDGAGHQLKINKNTVSDTAGLLFQTGFSGRAEMGLTGDDDYHFKVSPDGATWNEAILIDKDTGSVSFPNTSLGGGGGTPGGSDSEIQYNSSGAFAGDDGLTYNDATGVLASEGLKLSAASQSDGKGVVSLGSSPFLHAFGTSNVFLGKTCGNFTLTGARNIGIGSSVLSAATTASDNIALGSFACGALTTGKWNFALGGLFAETNGSSNVAVGYYALAGQNGASFNVGIGDSALRGATTGSGNASVGRNAGRSLTTGSYNTEIGYNEPAGTGVTTGSNNTIIGARISGLSPTLSNTVVLGDGSGTVRLTIDASGHSAFEGAVRPKSYTVAGLPSAAAAGAGAIAFVSDESAGAVLAFSDGSDWRRSTDRAVVS